MDSLPDGTQRCTTCEEIKFLDAYYDTKNTRSGKWSECKACAGAREKEKRLKNPEKRKEYGKKYYAENREKVRAQQREGYYKDVEKTRAYKRDQHAADPERYRGFAKAWREANPEKRASDKRQYYLKNKDTITFKNKAYVEANPEKVAARQSAWREANPGKVRVNSHRRRTLELNAEGSFTALEWEAKLALYRGKCHWCHKKIKGTPHADHVIPLAKGGTNYINNIVPSCATCNFSKGAKLPHDFAGRLF